MLKGTDAFEYNKYSEDQFVKKIIANSVIVSFGYITAIEVDHVIVTLAVSDRQTAEKASCKYMGFGSEIFSVFSKPRINMRVLVLAPNKGADGMYDSFAQMNQSQGRNYIFTSVAAVYSSQFALCIPVVPSVIDALTSIVADESYLSATVKQDIIATLAGTVTLDFNGGTDFEFDEETNHYRDYFGNLYQSFGMLQGIGGVEKEGDYEYEEIYGKYTKVKKTYESGLDIIVGKAYPTPFLEDKGELADASAAITVELGEAVPVTLTFGDSKLTVSLSADAGLDMVLTGSAKASIVADAGKVKVGNSTGSLKDVLNKIADLCSQINTTGTATAQTLEPGLAAQFSGELKTLIAAIFD